MVRMKLNDEDFDAEELDIEYEGPEFERYTGEVPKTGTVLIGRVTKAWWRVNEDDESQMPLIVVAEQNNGKLSEFNGLVAWEYLTWTPKNSRRYQPFLMNFGLTVKDVKNKMDVESEDDNIGTPVNKIGKWVVGSDDALCRFIVKRDWYNDEWRAKIDWDGWLPFEDDDDIDDEDEDDEDEQPARPTRGSRRAAKPAASSRRGAATTRASRTSRDVPDVPDEDEEPEDDDEYDDDVIDDEDDEEEEQEAARPARSRSGSAARTARSTPSRSRAARPAASSRGTRAAARSAGSTRSASRSNSRRADSDEPPF